MGSRRPQNTIQIWQIAKVNLWHNFLPLFLLAVAVTLLTPVLFGTVELERNAAAVPLEMFLATIGMIMLVPVFWPERNSEIEDVVASKYVDCGYVYVIRIVYSVIGILLLVVLFGGYMSVCGCDISAELIFGTTADAMFLGSLGLLVSAVTNQLPVSLMAPVLYYAFNYMDRSRFGVFNIFSMMDGDYAPNVWLFSAGIVLMAAAVILRRAVIKYH